jgi:hypothetical protein
VPLAGHRRQLRPARAAGPTAIMSRTPLPPPAASPIRQGVRTNAPSKADRSPGSTTPRRPSPPEGKPKTPARPQPGTRHFSRCLDPRPQPPPTHPFPYQLVQRSTAAATATLKRCLPHRREGLYSHWRGTPQGLSRQFY